MKRGKKYRIVALIDVTEREKSQREQFAQRLRDKDMLLKELQHRVKNNLQLITALIRLEARNQRTGDQVNLTGSGDVSSPCSSSTRICLPTASVRSSTLVITSAK